MGKGNFWACLLLFALIFCGCGQRTAGLCSTKESPVGGKSPSPLDFSMTEYTEALDRYYSSLSESQQVSQIFLVNINDNSNYQPVEYLGDEPSVPGGYLFFSYNIASDPSSIMDFTKSVELFCSKNNSVPPYLSVDQEGGYVNRFRNITSPLPSSRVVSHFFSIKDSYRLYAAQAAQMKELGFHMNLAPVAEPLNDSNKKLLEDRSYGTKADTVNFSKTCVAAYQNNGISCVLKHFPGNSSTDPHLGLPVITATKDQFNQEYISPFKEILNSNPAAVLMSHAIVNISDEAKSEPNKPACLDYHWVTEVLKNQLNYKGLIISDDIYMGALNKNGWSPETATVHAINAGVDVIMLTEKQFASSVEKIIELSHKDPQFRKNLERAEKKVITYKIKQGILSYNDLDDGEKKVEVNRSISETKEKRLKNFSKAFEYGQKLYSMNFQGTE